MTDEERFGWCVQVFAVDVDRLESFPAALAASVPQAVVTLDPGADPLLVVETPDDADLVQVAARAVRALDPSAQPLHVSTIDPQLAAG